MVVKEIWRGEAMNLICNEYKFNKNFKNFVDEYCKKNGWTKEDAFKDEQIKRIFWRYTEV